MERCVSASIQRHPIPTCSATALSAGRPLGPSPATSWEGAKRSGSQAGSSYAAITPSCGAGESDHSAARRSAGFAESAEATSICLTTAGPKESGRTPLQSTRRSPTRPSGCISCCATSPLGSPSKVGAPAFWNIQNSPLPNGIKNVAYPAAPPGCGDDAVARNERSAGPSVPLPPLDPLQEARWSRSRSLAQEVAPCGVPTASKKICPRPNSVSRVGPGWSPIHPKTRSPQNPQ